MSTELFKGIRNKVVSTTGASVQDKDIALIIYLYEESKPKTKKPEALYFQYRKKKPDDSFEAALRTLSKKEKREFLKVALSNLEPDS